MDTDKKKRVLVVDDYVVIVQSTVRALQKAGYEAQGVYNGTDALKKLQEQDFEFLVTDYFMPGKNGLDLVDFICAKGADTGVLVITSHHNNQEMIRRVSAYPKSQILVKPFPSDKVVRSLQELEVRMASMSGGPVMPDSSLPASS